MVNYYWTGQKVSTGFKQRTGSVLDTVQYNVLLAHVTEV